MHERFPSHPNGGLEFGKQQSWCKWPHGVHWLMSVSHISGCALVDPGQVPPPQQAS
jgi:hypothetical protein